MTRRLSQILRRHDDLQSGNVVIFALGIVFVFMIVIGFVVDGGASADGFDLDQLGESLRITPEEPTVDGDTADINFTAEEGGPATSRVRVMLTRLDSGYDCG